MGLTLDFGRPRLRPENHHGVGPRRKTSPGKITTASDHVAPVQRSLPPPVRSTVRVNLSASKSSSPDRGVPTPLVGAASKSSSLAMSSQRRPICPPPQGVAAPAGATPCEMAGHSSPPLNRPRPERVPGAHALGARYFGRPKLRPEKSPRRRTTSRRWQRSLPPSMRSSGCPERMRACRRRCARP